MSEETNGSKEPYVAVLLGWLVPGCGHLYAGRVGKALFFSAVVTGLFVLGAALGEWRNVSAIHHQWALLLQLFDGILPIGLALKNWLEQAAAEANPTRWSDFGFVCTLVSGALNALVMADAYCVAVGAERELECDTSRG